MKLPPIAILAGGLATRLGSITRDRPKAMVSVASQPFCALQLRQLRRQGFEEVLFLIGKMGDQIRDFVGDGRDYDLQVSYLEDGPELLGTGGAVRRASGQLGERFFVTYGDTYLRYDPGQVIEVMERTGADAVMTVLRNRDQWDASNIVLQNDLVTRYDKTGEDRVGMEWIDYGAILFNRRVLMKRPDGEAFDLADQLRSLSRKGLVAGSEVEDRFYEIGTPSSLAEADAFFHRANL